MSYITNNHAAINRTPIQSFYSGQNILITGGTGFLGKVLIEKLIRSCSDLSSIYVIVRAKKGQRPHNRLDALFDDPIFDRLKYDMPKFRHKIIAIQGDCALQNLGISSADRDMLIREVSIVFNVAATVRFDEKLKIAVAINIAGTKELLELCRQMNSLKVIMHVSTAYSNCTRSDIEEKFYEPKITGDNLIKLLQNLNDAQVEEVSETLIGDFPNTYAFTKCVAEEVVREYGKDLPAGIFRPAIVISTYREPVEGWIDNVYGPTGALVGGGSGLIRTLNVDEDCTAELVPADMTVNALIATAWDVANNKNEAADPPIYNYHSSWTNNVTWGQYMNLAFRYGIKTPSLRSVWCYSMTLTKNIHVYYILTMLLHIIPALMMDLGLLLVGKKTQMLKIYKKIHKFATVTTYFSTNTWTFSNKNVRTLWNNLSVEDKDIFFFSMKDFDWDDFMKKCIRGIRLYILKDDPNTIPLARKRMARILLLHKSIKYITILGALWILYNTMYFIISLGTKTEFLSLNEPIIAR